MYIYIYILYIYMGKLCFTLMVNLKQNQKIIVATD